MRLSELPPAASATAPRAPAGPRLLLAAAVAATCAVISLAPQLAVDVVQLEVGSRARLVRWIDELAFACSAAALLVPAGFAFWLWRARRRHGQALRPRRAWLAGLGMLLFCTAAWVTSHAVNLRLFQGRFAQAVRSPDDRDVAYLYLGGLFCGATVYRTFEGGWLAHRVESPSISCEAEATAELVWRGTPPAPLVIGPDGAPLVDDGGPLRGLYLGPH